MTDRKEYGMKKWMYDCWAGCIVSAIIAHLSSWAFWIISFQFLLVAVTMMVIINAQAENEEDEE